MDSTATHETPQEPLRRQRRTKFIVDPAMQLGAVFSVVGIAAGFLLIWFVVQLGGAERGTKELTGDQASRLSLLADGLFVTLALLTVAVYVVWLTQRVAGPARAIKAALEGMLVDDFDRRLRLRRKDFLKDVAVAAERVGRRMSSQRDETAAFLAELDAHLKRGDVESAARAASLFRDRALRDDGAPAAAIADSAPIERSAST
jgi:hypothetical protein